MGLKFSNFAKATVATPPTGTGGLAFTVAAGKGALYASLAGGDYFYGVFTNAAKSAYEVVKITARTGDGFTIDAAGRGLDGTTALAWNTGDIFYVPLTKSMLSELWSSAILALSVLTPAADRLAYFTGAATAALTTFTASARSILGLDIAAKGDLITGSGAAAAAVTSVGADGTVLTANSASTGGVSWGTGIPTGVEFGYWGTVAPSGFVFGAGRTIGSATSGATERANADTQALYVQLWNATADAQCPVIGGRGASAALDFAANKPLTLPDYRGRAAFGIDTMGGFGPANRVTAGGSGIAGTVIGAVGGHELMQQHQHNVSGSTGGQSQDHTHPIDGKANNGSAGPLGGADPFGGFSTGGSSNDHTHAFNVNSTNVGGGNSQNMPPAIMRPVIIKL